MGVLASAASHCSLDGHWWSAIGYRRSHTRSCCKDDTLANLRRKGGEKMSLSLDFSQVWTEASTFVNNMWPIFVIPLGLILGVGILNFIIKTLKGALSHF